MHLRVCRGVPAPKKRRTEATLAQEAQWLANYERLDPTLQPCVLAMRQLGNALAWAQPQPPSSGPRGKGYGHTIAEQQFTPDALIAATILADEILANALGSKPPAKIASTQLRAAPEHRCALPAEGMPASDANALPAAATVANAAHPAAHAPPDVSSADVGLLGNAAAAGTQNPDEELAGRIRARFSD